MTIRKRPACKRLFIDNVKLFGRKLCWVLIALFAVLLVWRGSTLIAQWQRKTHMENGKLELLSLYPFTENEDPFTKWKSLRTSDKKDFHGYLIIGETVLADGADKRKILTTLNDGMNSGEHWKAACFEPRHGVRATWENETTDFIICFECRQLIVYKDGKLWRDDLTIPDAARATFNEPLKRAGIKNPY